MVRYLLTDWLAVVGTHSNVLYDFFSLISYYFTTVANRRCRRSVCVYSFLFHLHFERNSQLFTDAVQCGARSLVAVRLWPTLQTLRSRWGSSAIDWPRTSTKWSISIRNSIHRRCPSNSLWISVRVFFVASIQTS